ncbi:MBL fold metallo-hydrolase [Cohnella luojiensis]|uniref:MBL fold metallo-hydrolase n=1 Tax=Cohnella luojiensis TaxID=652876 RepID=A0A4Y8LSJ4_9BACL|nr:MBL fold metallo-hydrolase [Cohnella luojiensis]TFE19594.1 MBL fold metallo-hydrolase [Cohnella luojiensis]
MIQYTDGHVTIFQSALFQTTSTVIELDDFILIVDPACLPNEIRDIQSHVMSIKGNKQCYLLFTHGDYDHIIGYNAFPGAKTIGSLEMQNHPKKEHKVHLIREFDAAYYITREYEVEFPAIDIVIEQDAQQITIGSTTLTFYKAPGHTQDGLFTIVDAMGVFLAGDYLSDFELPFIYHSAKAYEQTLNKVKTILTDHPIRMLIPGHGQHTASPIEMVERITMALDYLERLKNAVISGDEMTINELEAEFRFLSPSTVDCHRENVRIMQREYLGDEIRPPK